MTTREWCLHLLAQLNVARQACLEAAGRHADTVMPGYTHLQPAQQPSPWHWAHPRWQSTWDQQACLLCQWSSLRGELYSAVLAIRTPPVSEAPWVFLPFGLGAGIWRETGSRDRSRPGAEIGVDWEIKYGVDWEIKYGGKPGAEIGVDREPRSE